MVLSIRLCWNVEKILAFKEEALTEGWFNILIKKGLY